MGRVLASCRGYLLMIAERELDADLAAKGAASDLVQETLLTFEEIGRRMDRSSESARKLWSRALIRLAQEFGPAHDPAT